MSMPLEMRLALEQYITLRSGAQRTTITQAALLSGGAIQENWLIEAELEGSATPGPLAAVVRTDAPSAVSTSLSRAQEFALLSAVFAQGVTVPEPLWLCADASVIGRPFFIMRRIGGTASGHVLIKGAGQQTGLAHRLGMELARIHTLRPPHPELAFLPEYAESPALHLVARYQAFLDAQSGAYPALEWGLRWLQRHAPARGALNLCHGDFRTGNYMVDQTGLTGILDWEFASWGDALEDIGWFCAKCWRFGALQKEAGGIGERAEFYAGYEAVSGQPIARDQVQYWEVMAHMKWAVIAIQQAQRHVSGEEQSLLLALTGHIVPELEWQILTMTEHS